jgi:hypothetical protein
MGNNGTVTDWKSGAAVGGKVHDSLKLTSSKINKFQSFFYGLTEGITPI